MKLTIYDNAAYIIIILILIIAIGIKYFCDYKFVCRKDAQKIATFAEKKHENANIFDAISLRFSISRGAKV